MKNSTFDSVRGILKETGEISRFTGRFFSEVFRPRYEFREFFRQSFLIGYKSLPLAAVTAFIMGLVLTIQTRPPWKNLVPVPGCLQW